MNWLELEEWIEENRIGAWQAMAPLAEHTSWRIGGPARLMVWPEDEAKTAALLRHCAGIGCPLRFLGAGTNLLAADEGLEELVIQTGKLNTLEWAPDNASGVILRAGAGLSLAWLAESAAQQGYSGLEFAAGIPGSLGGAVAMNAGAFGGQISDLTLFVRVMDARANSREMDSAEAAFGYRSSNLRSAGLLILGAELRLSRGDREESLALIREHLDTRRQKQPLELPSGGSVFRNPAGEGAGRYIDRAGLKGLRIGNAQISPKHANFIVNLGGAKAEDVRQLMEIARQVVREKSGVLLENEIVYWN
ncbi:MAG: UDP-N-acetylmuramate dehydrogenase [Clostridiales bacterium]|nr:UDP-N-acetylmuramate dehydrogenase [Clostridiales bacterium]